jgi:hypothetical protein
MPVRAAAPHAGEMKKRIASAILWFYAAWYGWAILAAALGLSDLAGPVIGAAAAALFAGDPRRIIWRRPAVAGSMEPRPAES